MYEKGQVVICMEDTEHVMAGAIGKVQKSNDASNRVVIRFRRKSMIKDSEEQTWGLHSSFIMDVYKYRDLLKTSKDLVSALSFVKKDMDMDEINEIISHMNKLSSTE